MHPNTAVLFTIAKIWKQPKCPSRDEWIKKTRLYTYAHKHTHNRILLLILEKNETLSFAATQMDLEGIMFSEVSQRKENIV